MIREEKTRVCNKNFHTPTHTHTHTCNLFVNVFRKVVKIFARHELPFYFPRERMRRLSDKLPIVSLAFVYHYTVDTARRSCRSNVRVYIP